MINKFEIIGVHFETNDKIRNYVKDKLGNLDHYIPKHSLSSAHLEVRLGVLKNKDQQATCEVTLYLPHEKINLTETGVNIYAAVDNAKIKLKQSIQKYKDEFANGQQQRHIFARISRKLKLRLPTR